MLKAILINLAVNIAQYLSDRMSVIGDLLFPIPCHDQNTEKNQK